MKFKSKNIHKKRHNSFNIEFRKKWYRIKKMCNKKLHKVTLSDFKYLPSFLNYGRFFIINKILNISITTLDID